jgi:hypothetical protein
VSRAISRVPAAPTAEIEAARTNCLEMMASLKELLPLGLWDISISFEDVPPEEGKRLRSTAFIECQWEYQLINVAFNNAFILEHSPAEVFETCLHELCHALVSEMRMYSSEASQDHKIMHEERVVTGLTLGFMNVIWAGLSGSLKKSVGPWLNANN